LADVFYHPGDKRDIGILRTEIRYEAFPRILPDNTQTTSATDSIRDVRVTAESGYHGIIVTVEVKIRDKKCLRTARKKEPVFFLPDGDEPAVRYPLPGVLSLFPSKKLAAGEVASRFSGYAGSYTPTASCVISIPRVMVSLYTIPSRLFKIPNATGIPREYIRPGISYH
jgi:hypothetical protein